MALSRSQQLLCLCLFVLPVLALSQTYSWQNVSCSLTCGGGMVQYDCVNNTGSVVDSGNCSSTAPPNVTCNTENCTYAWGVPDWGSCSASCGDGTQYRDVACLVLEGDTSVDNSFCAANGSEPISWQYCAGTSDDCGVATGSSSPPSDLSYCTCSCCEGSDCTATLAGYIGNSQCLGSCDSLCRSVFPSQCPWPGQTGVVADSCDYNGQQAVDTAAGSGSNAASPATGASASLVAVAAASFGLFALAAAW